MKEKTKQKRLLKNEVFEELSILDDYTDLPDFVVIKILNLGNKISKQLSKYYLSWESIKYQRDEIFNKLQNQYPDLSNRELKSLVIEYIKEYRNSEDFKNVFGNELSFSIEIEDLDY